jgi:putative addiction module component (TIGR02574 family)
VIEVTTPRPPKDTRANCKGDQPSTADDFPSIVVTVPSASKILNELQKLSAADKFALAVELWDELSSNPDEMPVTEEQLNELDRRFEEYCKDPDKVVTWEEAKARILFDRR